MSRALRLFSATALRLALPRLFFLTAAYCGTSHADTPVKVEATPKALGPALRKLNPAPTQAFEIRLTLANVADLPSSADGKSPFVVIEGTAQFDASNAAGCGKSNALSGHVPTISSHEPFRLSRKSATEYVGIVYADMLLDEDYYGRGICHWILTEARVALRAREDAADTRFVAGLAARKLFAGQAQARYFWKGYYPRFKNGQHTDYGSPHLDTVPADKLSEFFTMTLTARKIADGVQGR